MPLHPPLLPPMRPCRCLLSPPLLGPLVHLLCQSSINLLVMPFLLMFLSLLLLLFSLLLVWLLHRPLPPAFLPTLVVGGPVFIG